MRTRAVAGNKPEGFIRLNESWDAGLKKKIHETAIENYNLYQIAELSRPHKTLDIKTMKQSRLMEL